MLCEWSCLKCGCKCTRCGYALKRDFVKRPFRNCTIRHWLGRVADRSSANSDRLNKQVDLGDWTERQLARIGVTKDRYLAAKELFGLAPTCNCQQRKEWLNRVSAWWRGQA